MSYPVTPAVRLLREMRVEFEPHLYDYVEHGGTAHSAEALGVDEHAVVKTLVMETDERKPLLVLMHGDREVSTKTLARLLGVKRVQPASSADVPTMMPGVPTITPTSAFNLAYNDYLNGKYDLAVAGFQRFVKDFPGTSLTPNAYYWLGESSYQQKDYVRAMQSFEYLSTEYPGNEKVPAALFKSGLAAGETGDLATSKKNLKRVIEEFPASDEAKLAKNMLAEIR